jgi:hypothetical protein
VTFTASARMFTPLSMRSRASEWNLTSLAAIVSYSELSMNVRKLRSGAYAAFEQQVALFAVERDLVRRQGFGHGVFLTGRVGRALGARLRRKSTPRIACRPARRTRSAQPGAKNVAAKACNRLTRTCGVTYLRITRC